MLTLDQIRLHLSMANMLHVANATGLTRQSLYNILKGSDPRWSTYEKLARHFEAEMDAGKSGEKNT